MCIRDSNLLHWVLSTDIREKQSAWSVNQCLKTLEELEEQTWFFLFPQSLVKRKVIFGIDSYFKGIYISFISGKQLYKYAEGLENHPLKENKGSLSVQYQLKTSLHTSCWDLTHVRGGKEGHSGKGSYAFTHPVLALGRNTVSVSYTHLTLPTIRA